MPNFVNNLALVFLIYVPPTHSLTVVLCSIVWRESVLGIFLDHDKFYMHVHVKFVINEAKEQTSLEFLICNDFVGMRGVAPPASRSRTVRSTGELHPVHGRKPQVFFLDHFIKLGVDLEGREDYYFGMASLSEICRLQEDFKDALVLMTKDRVVSNYYFSAVTAFARNFSDGVAGYRALRTGEGCLDGLVIFFGRSRGNEEIKVGIKSDLICISIPFLGIPVAEFEGMLVRPNQFVAQKNRKDLVLMTSKGAKVTLGLREETLITTTREPFIIKYPTFSVEYSPTSPASAAEAAAGTSSAGKS